MKPTIGLVEIPEMMPKRQIFFCPVGLVGAGKTTITKPLSKRLGLVRLSSDEIRKVLKENGFDYSPMKEICLRIADNFAQKGYSLAFDMDCGNLEVKDFVERTAKKLGADVIFVHVDTPAEFIFEKFRKHPPTWLADNPQKMIENYYSQKEKRAAENTHFDYFFTFDTSKSDLPDQIDQCYAKIQARLKTLKS